MTSRALFCSVSSSLQSLNKRATLIFSGTSVSKLLKAQIIKLTLTIGLSPHLLTIWVGLTKIPTRSSFRSSNFMSVAVWKITHHLSQSAPSTWEESSQPSECRNAEYFCHQNRPSRYLRPRSEPWSWTLCSHKLSHVKCSRTKHQCGTALQST